MKIIDERFFVDTNVLISATDTSRVLHESSLRLLTSVPRSGGHLVWSGQIIREYLVVATRPIEVNGLGLTSDEALENTQRFATRMNFLEETHRVVQNLRELTATHRLIGRRIHDANIVATMMAAGISNCITADETDYGCFAQIKAVSPSRF